MALGPLVTAVGRRMNQEYGFHGSATVPLVANGLSIGVLNVVDSRVRRFTEDEISLLTAFADQESLALEKARLLNEAETERENARTPSIVSPTYAQVRTTQMRF